MSETPQLFSDGQAYERLMGRWSQLAGAVFLDWLALPKGFRCLDVGCGNGAFTEVVIARSMPSTVIGIDPSEGQLAFARTRPGARSAQFQAGSAQDLPFADGSFDAALMALVISFVPDPAKAAREMARVVKPGGIVATYMWDIPGGGLPLEPIHVAMRSVGVDTPNPSGYAVSRQDAMRALWQEAGLQAVETRTIRFEVAYSGFDDFWDSNSVPIGPVGQAIHRLPPERQAQLKAELRKQLPEGPDGRITYEACANAAKGRGPP
jgi:ubiquinone/menaquinone biosynthesis C-methylase UbiE